jgi:hypothetical protein
LEEIALLDHLEALAESLGVRVRYDILPEEVGFASGGLCRLKGRYVVIINEKASKAEKIRTLSRALRRFDLGAVYLKPAVRELLEEEDPPAD